MSTRARSLSLVSLLLAAAVLVVGGWALLRPPSFELPDADSSTSNGAEDASAITVRKPEPPAQGYVGSAVCRDCHSDICDTFQMHSMGRATARIDEVDPIEDYIVAPGFDVPPNPLRAFDVRYYASQENGETYHHEQATARDGTLIYDQAVPVHFEVGSGIRGRSYITNRDGVLLMSPMSWYSESGRWDFSPGYRFLNQHFERRIRDGCIHCHAGRLTPVEGMSHRFDPARPIVEGAISCERCHGPGDRHVAFHGEERSLQMEDPIVNPADLEPHLRDSVCYQCHFHGIERIPRYGRSEYDFRPGDDMCDIWTIFVPVSGAESEPTDAVTQSEQMLSSTCYQQSDGRLGCVSCHDSHSLPTELQRSDYYRSRCLDCHAAEDPPCSEPLEKRLLITAADSCIDCHMPSIAADNVPHTSQTDHRVSRVPREHVSREGENLVTIFREETGVIPEAELSRARGIFLVTQAERSNNPAMAFGAQELLDNWLAITPDDLPAIEALGEVLEMREETNASIAVWERGLELYPEDEDLLRRVMFSYHDHGQPDLALEYGRRLVAVNPWYHDYWARMAHLLGQQGDFEEGIEAAERASALCPSDSVIHGWLAEAYQRVGNHEKAAEHQKLFDYLTVGE